MRDVDYEQEPVVENNFTSVFDLDSNRFRDREYVESFSRKNLEQIERKIESDLGNLAMKMGGVYVPPTEEAVEKKFNKTLQPNPFVFPNTDEEGRILALNGSSSGSNMENCAAFNNSGEHGVIIFPNHEEGETPQTKLRLFRGARIKVDQPQVAPLARIDGVDVSDLQMYREGKVTLDEILDKVKDTSQKGYLKHTLDGLRSSMANGVTTEMDELRTLHTCFTPGALDWDLWVSTSYKPEDTFRSGAKSVGNVYGDFYDLKNGYLEGVMILDVPESEVEKYNEEAGIFGEIKPEWIKAIVPQQTEALENNIKKALDLIEERKSN